MRCVGIDYHKKYRQGIALDERCKAVRSNRLENQPEVSEKFFQDLGGPSEAVLEASRTWRVMFDLLEELTEVQSVTLAHPRRFRPLPRRRTKEIASIRQIISHSPLHKCLAQCHPSGQGLLFESQPQKYAVGPLSPPQ
jgi:hypothetical protein